MEIIQIKNKKWVAYDDVIKAIVNLDSCFPNRSSDIRPRHLNVFFSRVADLEKELDDYLQQSSQLS